jgi:hypothetical protein
MMIAHRDWALSLGLAYTVIRYMLCLESEEEKRREDSTNDTVAGFERKQRFFEMTNLLFKKRVSRLGR